MKKFLMFGLMISLLIILGACGQSVNAPVTGSEGDDDMADWSFEVTIEKDETDVLVDMSLTNNQDKESTIDYSSGQKYEIVLTNDAGEELYRYSEGKMFTMALISETIAPGHALTLEERIPLEDINEGTYQLTVELMIAAIDGEPVEDKEMFTQTKSIDLK